LQHVQIPDYTQAVKSPSQAARCAYMRPEIYSTPETDFNKFMTAFPVGTGALEYT